MAAEARFIPPALDVDVVQLDGSTALLVRGELDLATAPALWEASTGVFGTLAPGSDLVLDMGGIEFVDAAGLGALVRLRNRLRSAGHGLRLAAARPAVRRVIALAQLDGIFSAGDDSGAGHDTGEHVSVPVD